MESVDPTILLAAKNPTPTGGAGWMRAMAAIAPITAHPQRTMPSVIDELARHRGEAPALLPAAILRLRAVCETMVAEGV